MISDYAFNQIKEFIESLPEDCFKPLSQEDLPDKLAPISNECGWRTKIAIGVEWVDLLVTLTKHFPYKVPRIYYVDPPFLIPHMSTSRDNHLCIVDNSSTFLDSSYPILILIESIEIAVQLIETGVNKENTNDFVKEFVNYWIISGVVYNWLSIIKPESFFKTIKFIEFVPELNKTNWLAAETDSQGLSWLANIDRQINSITNKGRTIKKIYQGIYLHLNEPVLPPYPKNNFEIYQIFKRSLSPKDLYLFNHFLFVNSVESIPVIISFFYNTKHDERRILGGFVLKRPNICKSKKPLLAGFRNSKIPSALQMQRVFSETAILKSNILRMDNERLQHRIGDHKMIVLDNKTILVIGCGSIGCRIALNCALAGVEKLILIDHDKLEADNIARHICSMKDIGLYKVEAVSKYIKNRMPHVDVVPLHENGYDLLSNHKQLFLDSDIIVSATGDKTFDLFLNELNLSISTLYSWIEINGYASHSLLVNRRKGGCFNCILDEFKNDQHNCVTSEAEEVLQQEAGCNTIYLPFSAIASDTAAGFATRLCLSYLSEKIPVSEYWIFYGDLYDAVEKELKISVPVENSFNLHRERISRKLNCSSCKRVG